jgi:hypothetical protein
MIGPKCGLRTMPPRHEDVFGSGLTLEHAGLFEAAADDSLHPASTMP